MFDSAAGTPFARDFVLVSNPAHACKPESCSTTAATATSADKSDWLGMCADECDSSYQIAVSETNKRCAGQQRCCAANLPCKLADGKVGSCTSRHQGESDEQVRKNEFAEVS